MRRFLLPRSPYHRLCRRPARSRSGVLFCAPQQARTTVINGKVVVRDGEIVTMEMAPVIATHNRCAARLANES